jgi:hypothetical protein
VPGAPGADSSRCVFFAQTKPRLARFRLGQVGVRAGARLGLPGSGGRCLRSHSITFEPLLHPACAALECDWVQLSAFEASSDFGCVPESACCTGLLHRPARALERHDL